MGDNDDEGYGGGGHGDGDIVYSAELMAFDGDEFDGNNQQHQQKNESESAKNDSLKTLLELTKGQNKHAAENEIMNKVFFMAVLCNFIAHRLVNSSGGPSPRIFDTDTRQYKERYPQVNIGGGKGENHRAPFDYDERDAIVDNDTDL